MPPAPQWRFGPFRLDTASGSLWQGDDLIPLRPKLYALLAGKMHLKDMATSLQIHTNR
jgi:hypothetical protein